MMTSRCRASARRACVFTAAFSILLAIHVCQFCGAETLSVTVERPLATDIVAGMVEFSGNSTGAEGVQISIDSTSWLNATGVPRWRYLWNSSAAPNGIHSVQARAFNGSQYAAGAAVQFTVNNTPPSSLALTLDISPQQVYAGEDLTASGAASFDNGVRASGGTVRITVANASTNVTTDSRGYYSAQLAAPYAPGRTVVHASMTWGNLTGTASGSIDVIFRAQPDLSVSPENMTFDPQEPSGGTRVTITAIVSNPGGTDASGTARFSTDNHDPQDVKVSVRAGGSWPASVNWSLPSGRHTITVSLHDVLPYDGNASNDNASRELRVYAKPDLGVSAIVFSNSRPTEKMTITIQARITNSGDKGALGRVTFYDGPASSGTVIGSENLTVEANATKSALVNWNAVRGLHNITVVVDRVLPDDPDPSNNELWRELEVSKKAPPPETTDGFGSAGLLAAAVVVVVVRALARRPGPPGG